MTKKLQSLIEQRDLCIEKLDRLRKSHIIETDAAYKFKLEKQIEETERELDNLEKKIDIENAKSKEKTEPKIEEQNKAQNVKIYNINKIENARFE